MLQLTEIDGVPVFHIDSVLPLSAELVFQVGVRDETFVTAGITHLVEHLAMSRIGRRAHDYNASVSARFTSFDVSGPPADVSQYLRDVCSSLGDLPLERRAVEAKVLSAEGSQVAHPIACSLVGRRFGFRGVGLVDVDPPALDGISPDDVTAYARRHFVRGNAAVALVGALPPGLDLPLASGAAPVRARDVAIKHRMPSRYELPGPGIGLSFETSSDEARREPLLAVLRIALERALQLLRHEQGWVYHVDFYLVRTSRGALVCWYADPPDEHAEEAWRGLLDILRDLARTGPTDAELAQDEVELRAGLDDPRSAEGIVGTAARNHLMGLPVLDSDALLAQRAAVTVEACRHALDELEQTLVVGTADGVPASVPDLPPYELAPGPEIGGRTYKYGRRGRKEIGAPREARLVVGDRGLAQVDRGGQYTVLWSDVVGLAHYRDDDVYEVVDASGGTIALSARWLEDGADAVSTVRARIPSSLGFVGKHGPNA